MVPTARRALEAYGGEARWRGASAIELELSARGLAFRLKWQPPLVRAGQRLDLGRPRVRCRGIDRAGNVGVLDGHDVRLESAEGGLIAERPGARAFFRPGRRWLFWDSLDQTYFACYAAWNYFALPALLLRDDIAWAEVEEGLLEARFPPSLPTHCPVQRFRFDRRSGLLVQHDYTVEIIGGWARAARLVLEHASAGGIPFPSRMRMTPRARDGSARAGPILVAVEAHRFELVQPACPA